MVALVKEQVIVDEWRGLYGESWTGVIVPAAFAHPAKYSRALIRFICQHVIDCGWVKLGDSVVDPFGGVALGGFDAMSQGLNWYGCELEEKFVRLGNQNIELWRKRYRSMPFWGRAELLQGDSRKLASVLAAARIAVASPPYATQFSTGGGDWEGYYDKDKRAESEAKTGRKMGGGMLAGDQSKSYGQSEGQLGAMKEGDLNLAISSPPYTGDALGNAGKYADPEKAQADADREFMQHRSSTYPDMRYSDDPANLGAMKADGFDAALVVSSPPYATDQLGGGGNKHDKVIDAMKEGYGKTDGQLGSMDDKGFQAAIDWSKSSRRDRVKPSEKRHGVMGCCEMEQNFGESDGQLGNQRGEDFWSASRIILEQLYQVITPGGHAVFVVKAFVRNKQIVDFPSQWAQLCEAVGFQLVHHHKASLVEHSGTQTTFHGEDKQIQVERKSFFRRLAEKKGSPRIDYESVLCFRKTRKIPATATGEARAFSDETQESLLQP